MQISHRVDSYWVVSLPIRCSLFAILFWFSRHCNQSSLLSEENKTFNCFIGGVKKLFHFMTDNPNFLHFLWGIADVYRDYFMENARVRFLFTSWVVSENERMNAANEWVFWYNSTSEYKNRTKHFPWCNLFILLILRLLKTRWKSNFCQSYARV